MRPILLDIPDAFETDRLILRSPRSGEGRALNEAVMESLAELRRWMPWAQQAPTVEDSEASSRLAQAHYMQRSDLCLRIMRKSDGMIVGSTGLHPLKWDVPSFEVGYWCRTSCCGLGYATEATIGVAMFAWSHLLARRLEIRCDSANLPSQRVAIKAGFQLEGRLEHDGTSPDGRLRTTLVYARTS